MSVQIWDGSSWVTIDYRRDYSTEDDALRGGGGGYQMGYGDTQAGFAAMLGIRERELQASAPPEVGDFIADCQRLPDRIRSDQNAVPTMVGTLRAGPGYPEASHTFIDLPHFQAALAGIREIAGEAEKLALSASPDVPGQVVALRHKLQDMLTENGVRIAIPVPDPARG